MPKNKKRKRKNLYKRRKEFTSDSKLGVTYTEIQPPLSELSLDERRQLFAVINSEANNRIPELLNELNKSISEHNPILTLSTIVQYSLVTGVGPEGVTSVKNKEFNQAFAEFYQALILNQDMIALNDESISHEHITDIIDNLKELFSAFSTSRLPPDLIDRPEQESHSNLIQEFIRSRTQNVRNWGSYQQVQSITKELFGSFDAELQNTLGYTATHIIDFFKNVLITIESKLNQKFMLIRAFKNMQSKQEVLKLLFDISGEGPDEAVAFCKEFKIDSMLIDDLLGRIVYPYLDNRADKIYEIDVEEVIKLTNSIPRASADKIMAKFSYSIGDLAKHKVEHFFLDNPVWKKPILEYNGKYFCFIPLLFQSFSMQILQRTVQPIMQDELSRRRAEYLEDYIERVIKEKFIGAEVFKSFIWKVGKVRYETDLLVLFDSIALIVEAKSHHISDIAYRGGEKSLKRHWKDIVLDPAIQTNRLEYHLSSKNTHSNFSSCLDPKQIKKIRKIVKLSVSLEDLSTLQTNAHLFTELDWNPKRHELCAAMNIADFETVFDYLEHPIQILHYLEARLFIQNKFKITCSEMDYLGFYRQTLLSESLLPIDEEYNIDMSFMSSDIDKYYLSKEAGVNLPKPEVQVSKFFKSVFQQLENSSSYRWAEVGISLNTFPPNIQAMIEKKIANQSLIIERYRSNKNLENILFYSPCIEGGCGLAIILFHYGNKNKRDHYINCACQIGAEERNLNSILVIAKNIDDQQNAYNLIGLFDFPSKESEDFSLLSPTL